MNIVALIPARYAATRFPAKLMQSLGGLPVIVQTYNACLATGLFRQVIVVTDSSIIADAINRCGGDSFISQRTHESGSDRIAEVAKQLDADVILNVQGDEPFVHRKALSQIIDVFQQDDNHEIAVASLMQQLHEEEKINDSNYVKVVVDHQGFALYFSRSPIPFLRDKNRQATYYEHIGVYAFRKNALLQFTDTPPTKLEQLEKVECLRFLEMGMKLKMIEIDYMGVEIDTPEDLKIANMLWEKKKMEIL